MLISRAVQRALLKLEDEGGNIFFGEPALDLSDWFDWDETGRGVLNILECQELFQHPLLYATFLLWLLSALYEMLPEAGDLDKPKIAFFFDEAHLLFADAPKSLLDKVEQVVRLIRSKGVSVWFISQQPSDLPDSVLIQIGNRIQHALRAYTPKDQKNLRAAAQSFRENPAFETAEVLQTLGVGEALISVLDANGVPTMVQKASIMPPRSSMKAAPPESVQAAIQNSPLQPKYGRMIDRQSAYEMLEDLRQAQEADARQQALEKEQAARQKAQRQNAAKHTTGRSQQTTLEKSIQKSINTVANTVGRELGKQIVRGLLGTFKR